MPRSSTPSDSTPPASTPSNSSAFAAFPDRIDRYRIVRLLGEGGMGAVYLAEQDEPVRRQVALKVLRPGADSADVIARFASERQALALMEHPNITHVYDAGLTPAGLPYFAMELVAGQPIDEYAAVHRLSTRARTGLVVQVCRAVQHAHQKGIIHRDLKPSNILVTEVDGEPVCKVIDFGIAMAIHPGAPSARVTAAGSTVGTPAYMSPEQFLSGGQDIDTRTDIYSLGVVLYELLAGVLPGGTPAGPSWESLVRRAEGDVPRPSAQFAALDETSRRLYAAERSTDPATLRRLLHGDVDSILLKALDADRERRYPTAAAFALDLEHYLADEPVTARRPSASYRFRKFAQRHRAGVVLAALLLVVVTGTAIGATIEARRLAVARAVAESRRTQAERLIAFMLNDLSDKLYPLGRLDVLDGVAQHALTYFASVPVATLSAEEVYQRAEALRRVGELRIDEGRADDATPLMAQARTLMRSLVGQDSANSRWQLGLAHAEYGAGNAAWMGGRVNEAVHHFLPFVEISGRLLARFPDSVSYRAERAYALNNIGHASEAQGDAAGALRSYLAAVSLLAPLVARNSAKVEWEVAFGAALNAAAVVQQKLGDLDAALRLHEEERVVRERTLERDSSDAVHRRSVAIAHVYLSDTRLWRGDGRAALAELDTARRLYESIALRDAANASWRIGLANAWRRTAQARIETGQVAAAEAAAVYSREILVSLLARVANAQAARELMVVDEVTAEIRLLTGRRQEAAALARRLALAGDSALAQRPADVDRSRQTALAYLVLGDASRALGDSAAATRAWSRALTLAAPTAATRRQTEFLALQLRALVGLGRITDAAAIADELRRRRVGLPSVVSALRAVPVVP
jgi:tetratricopeptide (TPR) repeat protein